MKKNGGKLVEELGPNAKPPILKRLFAGLVDMVIMFFFHYGLYSLVLLTPISNNIHYYWNEIIYTQEDIKVEAGYSEQIIVSATYEGKEILHTSEDGGYHYIIRDIDFQEDEEAKKLAIEKYQKLISSSDYYSGINFSYHMHNYLVTALLCGGVTELIFIFLIPLIKNRGQTLGMMIFQLSLFNPNYQGRPYWYHHLGRFAFMFLVESCIPYFFLAEYTILLVPAVHIVTIFFTKRNQTLHDLVSKTMVIDNRTFVDVMDSEED